MATRHAKTPPILHPAHGGKAHEPKAEAANVETDLPVLYPATGVADRGSESGVPFLTDGAGRRFVASPHPQEGKPW